MPLQMLTPLDVIKGPGHRSPRRLSASVNSHQPRDEPLACELIREDRVKSQPNCLLLTRCPREIRNQIYSQVLVRYEDLRRPYSRNRRYCKPGREHAPRIAIELLLSCSAIYVETFALPVLLNPLVAHHGEYEDVPAQFPCGFRSVQSPWQFAALQSVDVTLNQGKLEDDWIARYALFLLAKERHEIDSFRVTDSPVRGVISSVTAGQFLDKYMNTAAPDHWARNRAWEQGKEFVRNICCGLEWELADALPDPCMTRRLTSLMIRIPRTGWWTWKEAPESEKKLALDPGLGEIEEWKQPTVEQMIEEAEKRRNGTWLGPYPMRSWGSQVCWFKSLRTLELALETFATKRDQLEKVVECATTWTFPVDQGLMLVWDGKVDTLKWRGVEDYGYEKTIPWLRRPYIHGDRLPDPYGTQHMHPPVVPAEVDTSTYLTGHPLDFEQQTVRWKLTRSNA